jgi:hypothetical protein
VPVNTGVCDNWEYVWCLSLLIAIYHGGDNYRIDIMNCLVKPPMLDDGRVSQCLNIWDGYRDSNTHRGVRVMFRSCSYPLMTFFVPCLICYFNYIIPSTYSFQSYFANFHFSDLVFRKLLIYNWMNCFSR